MSTQQVVPVSLKTTETTFLYKATPDEEAVVGIELQNSHVAESTVEFYIGRNGIDKLEQLKPIVMRNDKGVTRRRGNVHIPPGYHLMAVTKFPSQVVRVYSPNFYTKPGTIQILPGRKKEVEVYLRNVVGEKLVKAVTRSIGYKVHPEEQIISQGNPVTFVISKDDISESDGQVMFVIEEMKAATVLDVELFKEDTSPKFVWRDSMMAEIYEFAKNKRIES